MSWRTFQLPQIPSAIPSSLDSLKSILSTTTTVLKAVKSLTEALSTASTTSLTASQLVIKTATSTIQAAIASLLEDAGLYVLLVPPRNKVLIPEAVKIALASSYIPHVNPDGLNLQEAANNPNASTVEAQLLKQLFTASGGNAGFIRSVIESFDDVDDANRPTLSKTDAVAGLYIVAGAANIASLISFTNGMSSLLTAGKPTALDAPALPTPQNLSVRQVTGAETLLQWTPQQPLFAIPVLDTWALITEIAVIHSPSVRLLSAATPREVFNTAILSLGAKVADGTEVIAVFPYLGNSVSNTYVDTVERKQGSPSYYAVSYRVKLGTRDDLLAGAGTDVGFLRFSNVSKVYRPKESHGTPRSIQGIPPDWYRTPNVASAFPAIGNALKQISAQVTQFDSTAAGYSEMLRAQVALLEQQILLYEDLALKFSGTAETLTALSTLNLGAVSIRPFSGVGGVDFIKSDLIKAFGDTADPNRPAFDNGEFVSGVVFLTTAPDAASLLNSLLGVVQTAGSQIAAALARIDVELSALENKLFDDSLQPTHAAVAVPSKTIPQIGDADSYCYHPYVASVDLGDDLKPKGNT